MCPMTDVPTTRKGHKNPKKNADGDISVPLLALKRKKRKTGLWKRKKRERGTFALLLARSHFDFCVGFRFRVRA